VTSTRGGAGRDLLRRRNGRQAAEDRCVAAARNVDPDVARAAVGQVVAFERAAQAAGLDADDGIDLRVEALVAPEDRGGDAEGLDPVGAPGQRLLDHMGKEPAVSLGGVEAGRREDAAQFRPHGVVRDGLCFLFHAANTPHSRTLLRCMPHFARGGNHLANICDRLTTLKIIAPAR
jgi:hypothetical protein